MSPQIPLALRFAPDQQLSSFLGAPDVVALVAGVAGSRSTAVACGSPGGAGPAYKPLLR